MKTTPLLLSLTVLLAFASFARAAAADTGVKHSRLQGKTTAHGEFNIDYVQLVSQAAADVKINKTLQDEAEGTLCDGASSQVDSSTEVTYLSDRLIALRINSSIYCEGAAHPDGGNTAEIFDRSTGEKIDIRTGQAPDTVVSAPAINNLILDEMVAQAKVEKELRGDDECDADYARENLSFYSSDLFLNAKELVVQSSEAHSSMACQFETKISLKKFAPVTDKNSLLGQLAAAAK